jgi:hypothetical protein
VPSSSRKKGELPHGNNRKSVATKSGKSLVASGQATAMAGRNALHHHHHLPQRPVIASQQSSSVPSTPHQRPRRNFNGSRSPSPRGLSGGHSPRSVVSEANGHMTALPKGKPACKYETKTAFSRRRIQYDIGDAPLEHPSEKPRPSLSPEHEKKLSRDLRKLYHQLLPSPASEDRRRDFVTKLERILHKEWPEHQFQVHVFGSSGNLLCTSDSDGTRAPYLLNDFASL